MSWVSLHGHSDFSTKDSIAKVDKIAAKCAKYDMGACAITDHGNIAAVPSFFKEMKKKKLKPIAGCEVYVSPQHASIKTGENRSLSHLLILATNLAGWHDLIKIVSTANYEENFYYSPRLSLEQIGELNTNKNLIAFSGHVGSTIADAFVLDKKTAYGGRTYEQSRAGFDIADWEKKLIRSIGLHQEVFGKGNFWLETQDIDLESMMAARILGKTIRHLSKKLRVPKIGTSDFHFVDREDAFDQRILLCDNFHTTLSRVEGALARGEDATMGAFFRSQNYYLPTPAEMEKIHTEDELKNTLLIADMCEDYDITAPPSLPVFKNPHGESSSAYLRRLCERGWNEYRIDDKPNRDEYRARLEHELNIFSEYNIDDYFLIASDIVQDVWNRGYITGHARGSAGGCLTALLCGITYNVDPLENNLLFERFLNEGRLSKTKGGSLPDIDIDFMVQDRQNVISFITEKYGSDKVGGVATFGALKGKSALKCVLRARESVPAAERDAITKCIYSDAAISDDLQEQLESDGFKSVILLSLQDNAKELKKWFYLDKNGEIQGELAIEARQAIRLEWVRSGVGRHASAILVSDSPLINKIPLMRVKDKDEGYKLVGGLEFPDAESCGVMKLDILGNNTLDKVFCALQIVNGEYDAD